MNLKKIFFLIVLGFSQISKSDEKIFHLINSGKVRELIEYLRYFDKNHIEDSSNIYKMTPLQQAVSMYNINHRKPSANNFKEIIKLLMLNGADPYYREDGWKKRARDINPEIIEAIEIELLQNTTNPGM